MREGGIAPSPNPLPQGGEGLMCFRSLAPGLAGERVGVRGLGQAAFFR